MLSVIVGVKLHIELNLPQLFPNNSIFFLLLIICIVIPDVIRRDYNHGRCGINVLIIII